MTGEPSPPSANASELFTEFLKLLAHELRSPLSILATDLQYLTSPGADQTISTWKGALARITEQLNALGAIPALNSTSTHFPAALLLRRMEHIAAIKIEAPIDSCSIPGNGPTIIQALTDMLALHQADSPPQLILNSRQVIVELITAQELPNRQRSAFFSAAFALNPGVEPLKLWLAELVLRLTGAVFDQNSPRLTIALPLNGNTPGPAC